MECNHEQPRAQAGSPGEAQDKNAGAGPEIDKYVAVEPP